MTTQLDNKSPIDQKPFVGIRTIAGGAPRLIIKMKKRKYPRWSAPLLRPAFVRPTPSSRAEYVLYMTLGFGYA